MTVSRLRIALLMAASALALAPDPATAGVEKRRGSSPDGLWTEVVRPPAFKESFAPSSPSPRAYRRFRVQPELLRELLERAPLESGVALPRRGAVGARGIRPGEGGGMVMTLPMPDGTFPRFRVLESPILAPELGRRYPEIRTYRGQGLDDPLLDEPAHLPERCESDAKS